MPRVPAQTTPTSVFSMLRDRRALYAPVLAIAAFGLVACSGKPENSPVIRKKFAEVDAMKEELNTAITELRAATGQMTVIREQVSELRAFAPDGEGASAIVSRIEAIENRLTALSSTAGQTRTVAQNNSSDQPPARSTERETAGAGSGAAEFGGLATSAGGSTSTASTPSAASSSGSSAPTNSFRDMTNRTAGSAGTTTPPARTETAARSTNRPAQTGTGASVPTSQSQPANRGRYHTIETGDTLEKLARDNNTSVEALREANRLPAGARPLKGQRLFIPPAR